MNVITQKQGDLFLLQSFYLVGLIQYLSSGPYNLGSLVKDTMFINMYSTGMFHILLHSKMKKISSKTNYKPSSRTTAYFFLITNFETFTS